MSEKDAINEAKLLQELVAAVAERDQLRQRIETAVEELRTSRWDNARKAGYRFDEAKWMERDLRIESALKALKVKL